MATGRCSQVISSAAWIASPVVSERRAKSFEGQDIGQPTALPIQPKYRENVCWRVTTRSTLAAHLHLHHHTDQRHRHQRAGRGRPGRGQGGILLSEQLSKAVEGRSSSGPL